MFTGQKFIIYISIEKESFRNIVRVSGQLLIPPWYSFCMFSEEHRSYLSSNTYINKNYVEKPFWNPRKSFGDSTKDRYFSRLYNDRRNMFININKENCVLIFFEKFPKHVKMA